MRLDENRVAQSIAAAFDRLPGPEAARLEAIERRLAGSVSRAAPVRRPRKGWWWLMVGLVATGAAAWWADAYLGRDSVSKVESPPSAPAAVETIDREHEQRKTDQHADVPPENASPESETSSQTIYRREVY